MTAPDKKSAGIGKGTPGPGRGKGTPNKTTTALKEAILLAARKTGETWDVTSEDGCEDGLVTYLERLARDYPTAFATLLGKVLPLTLAGEVDTKVTHVFRTTFTPKPDAG